MSRKYRWDWERRESYSGGQCVIYNGQDKVAVAIGPAVAERLVEALNAVAMPLDLARKVMRQELVREQAARDDGGAA